LHYLTEELKAKQCELRKVALLTAWSDPEEKQAKQVAPNNKPLCTRTKALPRNSPVCHMSQ